MTNTQRVTVINSLYGSMHVHKAGCADLAEELRHSNDNFMVFASTRTAVLEIIWEDFIEEWGGDLTVGRESTKFFPCVVLPD